MFRCSTTHKFWTSYVKSWRSINTNVYTSHSWQLFFMMSFVAHCSWRWNDVLVRLPCNGMGLGPTLFVRLVSCECISFGLVVCYSHPKTVCELTYKSRSMSRLTTLYHIKVKSLDGVHTYQTVSLSENVSAYHFRLRIKHSTHKH